MPAGERPVVFMLCGFVGSGKTTYSRSLEAQGCVRLSVDELIFDLYGRHGVDYDESEYPSLEAAALLELDDRLRELLAAGRDLVLDYGFWSRERRDRYKQLIEAAGGRWRLIYLQASLDELRRRLAERNRQGGPNALEVTDRHFEEFLTRWDPPTAEGEEIIALEQD